MEKERTIVIDICLNKVLALVLIGTLMIAALPVYAALSGEEAEASHSGVLATQSNGLRQFYLTETEVKGWEPLTECAEGYHFASLWEIADPSNLKYNHALGLSLGDSGQGPPSDRSGWVRTGYVSNYLGNAGESNCAVWTSDFFEEYGTVAYLPADWVAGDDEIGIWAVDRERCGWTVHVWCIED